MKTKLFTLLFLAFGFLNSFAQTDTIPPKFSLSDDYRTYYRQQLYYPVEAAEMGIQGLVKLRFRVNTKGCIDSIIVLESPHLLLSNVGISALKQYNCDWTPATLDNKPIDYWLSMPFLFSLHTGEPQDEYENLKDAIKYPHAVKYLKLHDKNLTEIPKEVFRFPNLFTLDLENNNITDIPIEIQKCNQLTFLMLKGNHIKTLPKEILSLKKLIRLDLSRNELSSVPNEVYHFKKLWKLDLSYNQLTTIHSDIENLKKLRVLGLANNKLEKLPEEFFKLKKLQFVDLRGNSFSDKEKDLIKSRLPKTKILF